MNEERTRKCLWQVVHIRCHLWHRYSVSVNQVMVVTAKLMKWWLQHNQLGTLGLVTSLLAATLYQGNPDRNNRLWNIGSTEIYTLYMYSICISCNNVAPVTNLCLGGATKRSHSSQWSKKITLTLTTTGTSHTKKNNQITPFLEPSGLLFMNRTTISKINHNNHSVPRIIQKNCSQLEQKTINSIQWSWSKEKRWNDNGPGHNLHFKVGRSYFFLWYKLRSSDEF